VRDARHPDTPFWVEPANVSGDRLNLDSVESHHLVRVHRAAPGSTFDAVDGIGGTYRCVLESIGESGAVGRIVERWQGSGELAVPITMLVGLLDSGPAELVVEFGSALGATAIDFVACARSGRPPLAESRLDRLTRIARSAIKQSRRSRLPALRSSGSLAHALSGLGGERRLLADPGGVPFMTVPRGRLECPVVLAVGPPGGFDDGELACLREGEFDCISLGPNRLATETAALALLVIIRNALCSNNLRAI